MKKKIAVFIFAMMSVGVLNACGSDKGAADEPSTQTESSTEGTNTASDVLIKDYDVENYVTLCDYQNMAVTVKKPVVDEQMIDSYISSKLSAYGGKEEFAVTDRAVEQGDTVNINYSGKLDGVAFDGGTDDSEEGTNLLIGSGSFIPGFEDGLVGVMPGETVDLTLTFPETYKNNPDLAGKETVFTVTVNGIAPTAAELTDALAASLDAENPTVDKYKESVKAMLVSETELEFENYYSTLVENAIVDKMLKECVFAEVPEELITRYRTNYINNTTQSAAAYGMDLETYVAAAYQMEYEEFEKQTQVWAEDSAKQALAFQAIANKENLNIDDETLAAELDAYAKNYGYESAADLPQDIGEDYREYLTFMAVLDYLSENAQVTVE